MSRARTIALALIATLYGFPGEAEPASRLHGGVQLAKAYDFILDARFDQAEAELRRACGPAPIEACHVLRATARWWRIQLDPSDRALDAPFQEAIEQAIRDAEAWTERAPESAEAWFYLGGAYAVRVQWRVLRGERVAAARDGKRIKRALEQALELEPDLEDAYFGLGLYKYYADIAPTAAKMFRWLLLLPGGDRREGLEQMVRAQGRGELLQGEADYQLHLIYLWYERRADTALALLEELRERYKHNPVFPLQIADLQDTYLHDTSASLATYRSVLTGARGQRFSFAPFATVRARFGIARHLEALHQTDLAIEQLKDILEMSADLPYSTEAQAHLALGQAYDRLGMRDEAVMAYRAALAAAPADDPFEVRDRAQTALRRKPDARAAEAYRLSLEGWRLFERQQLAEAETNVARSLALKGNDPVAQYRYGRILQARHEGDAALAAFQRVANAASACPAPILASSYLQSGRVLERAGKREAAIGMYRRAAGVFGASAETRTSAARALTRLRAAAPSKKPTDPPHSATR